MMGKVKKQSINSREHNSETTIEEEGRRRWGDRRQRKEVEE
jgi:hypothetical protein